MAVDKLVDSTQLDADLTSVANAIRTKGGTYASLAFPAGFVSAIDAIPTGGGTDYLGLLMEKTISSYSNNTVTTVPRYLFYHVTSLKSINIPAVTNMEQSAFEAAGLEGVFHHPSNITVQQGSLAGTNITIFVFEKDFSLGNTWALNSSPQLTAFDAKLITAVKANTFNGNSSMSILVLRDTKLRGLDNINAFTSTPFASSGSGGTLYVPSSLISSYQAASNWSTILGYANNSIKSIESTHTDPTAPIDLTLYYADGTPIST